jgi:hypothetical protein
MNGVKKPNIGNSTTQFGPHEIAVEKEVSISETGSQANNQQIGKSSKT